LACELLFTKATMKWAKIILLQPLILPLLFLAAFAGTKTPSPIEVNFHSFSNGLNFYHVKVEEAINFKLSITVWVGSVDENRKENGGVSHLLEHILFHQPDMPEKEFNALIESRGGTHNGATSTGYTQYYVTLPYQHLELGQNWLHKVLFHDRLVTDRLEEEKEIVNRENGWSTPTWWDKLLTLISPEYLELPGFWEQYFGMLKYDNPIRGTYKIASKLTVPKIEAHYREYYYPENMVLLYIGPHELEEVLSSIEDTFGRVTPTGRTPNLHSLLKGKSPQPYFFHEFPEFSFNPEYGISIGHIFTGVRYPQLPQRLLYQFVLRQLLKDRKPSSGPHTNSRDSYTAVLPQDGKPMEVIEKPSGELDAPSGSQEVNDGR